MILNLTQIGQYLNVGLWVLGVVVGTYAVHSLAKQKVDHVTRSTVVGFLLSVFQPLVLIQIVLLIRKPQKL
ncbi:hypothetical protein GCM10022265_40220 [Marinobacter xestospongiae]